MSLAALTGCSSGSEDEAGKPLTKQFEQGEITQALPGPGEVLPGWEPYKGKRVTSEGIHKSAYASWKGTERSKERTPKKTVGDETVFVVNPGLSENSVHGFSRSGSVSIRVELQGTGGDTTGVTGVQDMLAATLKRLQQVQDGKRATATAGDEAAKASKK
ncbi:hypothetical protein [Streptomyces sp. UNOB3_S3]|uniref:hypothetical protein n=1 Tax=Streptomyces sp. UNOB3_S3 TaxID=2871682 RepID=UPI001E5F0A2F|nr:hypothetical protein [Streptomyces sp. UNOB3_S3]